MIEPVEIARPAGGLLRGQLHSAGDDCVLLVHEPGRDLDAWDPLPQMLSAYRLTVLAIDLAGHGGSEGERDPANTAEEAAAAAEVLRRRADGPLFVGAAGASAAPALAAAHSLGARGFFAIDPVLDEAPRLPTLAILPALDEQAQAGAELLRAAAGWTVAAHVPVRARGLELLSSDWSENVQAYVATFLNDLRLGAPRPDPAGAVR